MERNGARCNRDGYDNDSRQVKRMAVALNRSRFDRTRIQRQQSRPNHELFHYFLNINSLKHQNIRYDSFFQPTMV